VRTAAALLIFVAVAVGVSLAAMGASISACSGPGQHSILTKTDTVLVGNTSDPGSVGLHLVLQPGDNLYSLNYTCTGPNAIPSGTVNFNDAQSIEFVLGGIAAGSGYQCTLTGFDTGGDYCTGVTTQFNVLAGQVSTATVAITCTIPADSAVAANITTGGVSVDAGIGLVNQGPNACPGISALSISPAELVGSQGAQISLGEIGTLSGIGADGGPESTNVTWTVACTGANPPCGGFFSPDGGQGSTLMNPIFECGPNPGQVTVTATISQYETSQTPSGPVTTNVCAGQMYTTLSALVNCEPFCTNQAEGTPCNDSGGTVCNGAGQCVPFTFEVVRLGTGDSGSIVTVGGTAPMATPLYIEQRLVYDGGIVAIYPLPATSPDAGQFPITMPGATAIISLSRSQDGHYVTLAGYGANQGTNMNLQAGTFSVNTASPIVVGRLDKSGNVDTSTSFSADAGAFMTANMIRSSASADGGQFWVTGLGNTVDGGYSGGLWYIPFGTVDGVGDQVVANPIRVAGVNGGQLYATGEVLQAPDSGELMTIGTGLPTTAPAAPVVLPGLPISGSDAGPGTVSPWQFVFLQMNPASTGPDTLYIANDLVGSGTSGYVARWTLSGGTWTGPVRLTVPAQDGGAPSGIRGLAGLNVGGTAVLIATTAEPSANRIVVFTDNGSSNPWSGTATTIAVANDSQMFFRGVALSPH
jgi:hypothetical protein